MKDWYRADPEELLEIKAAFEMGFDREARVHTAQIDPTKLTVQVAGRQFVLMEEEVSSNGV